MRFIILAVAIAACTTSSMAQQQRKDHISECFTCHGEDGIAKEFDVPHLAGQQETYLLNQMKAFKAGKRPHKEMRIMSRTMTDQDMKDIAAFFASLPRDPK